LTSIEFCIIYVNKDIWGDEHMGFYNIITKQFTKSGTLNSSDSVDLQSPYNYLNMTSNIFYQTNTPFSLVFTRYSGEEENPFRLMILSPDFLYHIILSRAEFEQTVLNRPLHQHDTYELMYILKGELFQRIENSRHKYIENSCCLINRNVRHAEEYTCDFYSLNLSLSKDFLSSLIASGDENYFMIEKNPPKTDLTNFLHNEFYSDSSSAKKYIDFIPQPQVLDIKQYIYTLLDQITNMMFNPFRGASMIIKAFIYRIFCYLNDFNYYHTEPINLGSSSESQLFAQINRLMEKTNGRISRSELSEKLNYSGNYINYVIQKYSGLNTFEYGISFTMQKASSLLVNTNKSVSEIIELLDFSDRTHFYRLFQKEFGMTPRNYRLQQRKETK